MAARPGIPATVFAAFFALLLCAAARAEPMQDVDYVLIDPPVARPGAQVEVVEFFHYGCGACFRLEPLLDRWVGQLPADVLFLRVPALRNTSWIPLTRLFYTLDELGELPRLHGQVYRDIHENAMALGNSTRAGEWAERNGLDRRVFLEMLNSPGVTARVQRARDLTEAFGVHSTPSLLVDGRYLTSAGMTGSADALLPVVDALIDKARALRAKP